VDRRVWLLATTALASGAVLSGPSRAADLNIPVKAAPAIAPFSWSGCYVGVNAGGVGLRTKQRIDVIGNPAVESSGTDTGFIGGAQAGCNHQTAKNWVFGIEGDINYVSARRRFSSAFTAYASEDAYGSGETRLRWLMTLRGRLGHVWNQSMLYVTGGLAGGDVKSSFSALEIGAGDPFHGSYSGIRFGWTVGGGFEHAFTNRISGKIEYLHFDLGKVSYPVIGPTETWNATANVSGDIVRVGLNFKLQP